MRGGAPRRVPVVALAGALAVAVVGCGGGGDGDAETSSTVVARPTSSVSTTTSTVSSSGLLRVEVDVPEIWMTLPPGADAAQFCSPATPAVAMVAVQPVTPSAGSGVELAETVRGRAIDGNRRVDLSFVATADDAGLMAVVGPFEASRASTDRIVTIEVESDAGGAAGSAELLVRAPEPCGSGTRDRRDRSPVTPDMELRTTPADGVFVAAGMGDCAARPTEVGIEARTKGDVVAVHAVVQRPDGASTIVALGGGPGQWRTRVGGFGGSAGMPSATPIDVDVTAVVADGSVVRRSVQLTFARPVPCSATTVPGGSSTVPPSTGGSTPPTTAPVSTLPPTAPPTTVALGVRARTPSPANIDAVIDGACPARPTTFTITADTQGSPDSVAARVTVPGLGTNTYSMAHQGGGVWAVTLGPVNGSPSMPTSGTITVEVRAERAGQTVTDTASLTVHRPSPCS